MQTSLGDNVDLDGGVTARVVDGASVNLGDRHRADFNVSVEVLRRVQEEKERRDEDGQ